MISHVLRELKQTKISAERLLLLRSCFHRGDGMEHITFHT